MRFPSGAMQPPQRLLPADAPAAAHAPHRAGPRKIISWNLLRRTGATVDAQRLATEREAFTALAVSAEQTWAGIEQRYR